MRSRSTSARRQFQPFFRVIRYTKTVRGAEQMVRYVAFRSRDLADRQKGGFDKEHDHADIKSFVREIPDRLTRHPAAPKAFHCLFSLPRDQFERCGLQQWREVVRDVMAAYERETGKRLEWIAAQHDNERHPHCHVIIKAVYEKDGAFKRLHLSKGDLQRFRRLTGERLQYERTQQRAIERPPPREPDRSSGRGAISGVLAALQMMIENEKRRRRREEERDRRRWEEEERER